MAGEAAADANLHLERREVELVMEDVSASSSSL